MSGARGRSRTARPATALICALAAGISSTITGSGVAGADPPSEPLARVSPSYLSEMPIGVVPSEYFTEFGPTPGAHTALTAADTWHTAGIDGTGIKVGVIDFFDIPSYWDEAEHGPTPVAGVNARCIAFAADCTDTLFDGVDEGGEDHGVAVVELIKDMAPGAQIFIGSALTTDDYVMLIDWFAANGVTVLNRSLGSRYDGPGDGRSPLDEVASYANARGIAWINSGGNNGRDRYYRQPVRLVGGRVAFGPSGANTFLQFKGCTSPGGVRWANDWDKPAAERTDYDVYIWDSPTGNPAAGAVIAASTTDQRAGARPVENFGDTFCPSSGQSLFLEIRWRGGDIDGDVIEILDYGSGMAELTQAQYAASTSIVDSTEPGVVAVGAVDPPGSGTLASYSSQGPTNDGRLAPEVSAAAGFASATLNGTFSGTSASAAVVTGGAALLLDAGLAADPASLGNLIRHSTIDRGPAGPDNAFGHGEFRLPSPPVEITTTPSTFVPLTVPTRVLDTRPESADGPIGVIGTVEDGGIRDLQIVGKAGIPTSGVTAVAVNLTAVGIDRPAFAQALPAYSATVGGYSNVNIDGPGQTRANFAIVPVGINGSISIYSTGAGHLIVDVLGYFTEASGASTAGRFVELGAPERLLDTRTDQPLARMGGLAGRAVRWPTGLDPTQVSALVVTVTGTRASEPGWLQVYPGDRPDVIATSSTVNIDPGLSVANTAIVPVGANGLAVTGFFGAGSADAIVDVIGYITSDAAPASTSGQFVPVRPVRAFDSRTSTGALTVAQEVVVDATTAPGAVIPNTASGVVWNVAAVTVSAPGFGRAWSADAPRPATSAFNWSAPGETRAASVISAVDTGRARFLMDDGSSVPGPVIGHLIADVFGYFT